MFEKLGDKQRSNSLKYKVTVLKSFKISVLKAHKCLLSHNSIFNAHIKRCMSFIMLWDQM